MRAKRYGILLMLALVSQTVLSAESQFRIAGVQFRIDETMYESTDTFALAVEKKILQIVLSSDGANRPDLIVFPEYFSVFLALAPYAQQIEASESVADAWASIRVSDASMDSIRQVFLKTAGWVEGEMDRIWGAVAARYGVAILAGTYFAERAGELYNLLVLYDAKGNRMYDQAKVYLTDFERDVIGLEPGSLENAELWELNGIRMAATICRDTFFASWNKLLGNADYWIDIKANGEEYTTTEAARFLRALPERIADTGVSGGMTVCLTGSYLDLFWEGRSFTAFPAGSDVLIGESANTATRGDVLIDVWNGDESREP